MYVTTTNAKRDRQFEGEYGETWREEMEGRNDDVIIL